MRTLLAAAMAVTFPTCALAQTSPLAVAEKAMATRDACFNEATKRATLKQVSPETFKLVIEGACQEEVAAARVAFSAALDASVPSGLSFDALPSKIPYMRDFDAALTELKAKLISDFALKD
ncbi:hypothetical protein [Sphingomonas japonica]|uniref:Uncharacterized protein n=1 Tax=Sphingomonas japonica TaxID=511662 RepID=A0ABX0U270_9SPHN|nr:hypothetical protein [Sphingomonas japonica]NIJ22862.1 hypothetical protein [Sphingomonas japonica]